MTYFPLNDIMGKRFIVNDFEIYGLIVAELERF